MRREADVQQGLWIFGCESCDHFLVKGDSVQTDPQYRFLGLKHYTYVFYQQARKHARRHGWKTAK